MKEDVEVVIDGKEYDSKIIASDWRYSASIVGLVKYFKYHNIAHHIEDDYVLYNYEEIKKEKYLDFAEKFFKSEMHHMKVVSHLETIRNLEIELKAKSEIKNITEDTEENEKPEEIKKLEKTIDDMKKELKGFTGGNTVVKKVFKGCTIEHTHKETFEKLIEENRYELIENTFKNGKKLYRKFNNSGKFFNEKGKACRVVGYSVDEGRKIRSLSYNFDATTFVYEDCLEFDFIPFGFTRTRESFFVNNNYSVKGLLKTFDNIVRSSGDNETEYNPREVLFKYSKNSSTFIKYDVEVITKGMEDTDFYNTKLIKEHAIKTFEKLGNYNIIMRSIKMSNGEYINIEKIVTENIINDIYLDNLIITLLKQKLNRALIDNLINVNTVMYKRRNNMTKESKQAYAVAKSIVSRFSNEPNKLISYRTKLISALAVNDYDSFNKILLKLSSQTSVELSFAYDLFEDFESNKNIAFTFVNALQKREEY